MNENPPNMPLELARAYVPFQPYGKLYDAMNALERGTLFADLDKPYKGR